MSVSHQTTVVSTPLPLPTHFSHAQQSYSLKKRRLPFSSSTSSSSLSPCPISHSSPPRPPSKGCPPLSRVFPHRPAPWIPLSRSLIESPPPRSLYDPSRAQTFFNQCFTNLGLIGRGSFGEVFKVVSLLDGAQYAVKRSVQRFRSEAWEEGGHLYIQTELCCSSLLVLAEERPSHTGEACAWKYLCDMLSALKYLHAQGFAHMDIKPANVFVTKSGRLKLGDFGLLIKLSTDDQKLEIEEDDLQEGDPRYMAPELLRGKYGTAADIFSLGVSILELACNIEVPKGGDDWQQLRQGYLPAEFTNALSAELQYVLRLMLKPEPCDRATASQLLTLPTVSKRTWRRQLSLYIIESFLSLFYCCQSLLTASWSFISSLSLPITPFCASSPPSTPPRERWERETDLSHSDSPTHDCVFPSDEPQHSPTFSHRVKARLSVGSTSTPLQKNSPCTPTHSQQTRTPSITPSSNSPSPIHHSTHHLHSDSLHSQDRRWINNELAIKSIFEPKNLLTLFDEVNIDNEP